MLRAGWLLVLKRRRAQPKETNECRSGMLPTSPGNWPKSLTFYFQPRLQLWAAWVARESEAALPSRSQGRPWLAISFVRAFSGVYQDGRSCRSCYALDQSSPVVARVRTHEIHAFPGIQEDESNQELRRALFITFPHWGLSSQLPSQSRRAESADLRPNVHHGWWQLNLRERGFLFPSARLESVQWSVTLRGFMALLWPEVGMEKRQNQRSD